MPRSRPDAATEAAHRVDDDETFMSTPQRAISERRAREDEEQGRRFRGTHRDLPDTFDAGAETRGRD